MLGLTAPHDSSVMILFKLAVAGRLPDVGIIIVSSRQCPAI